MRDDLSGDMLAFNQSNLVYILVSTRCLVKFVPFTHFYSIAHVQKWLYYQLQDLIFSSTYFCKLSIFVHYNS